MAAAVAVVGDGGREMLDETLAKLLGRPSELFTTCVVGLCPSCRRFGQAPPLRLKSGFS